MNDTEDETMVASKRGKAKRTTNRRQFISSIESETVSKHDTSKLGPQLVRKKAKNSKLRQSMKIHSISNNYYNANGNPRNFRISHDFESLNQNLLNGGRFL